jgi:HEPN domain-containing protein
VNDRKLDIVFPATVNKKKFQALAEARLKDARSLYEHSRFDAAYYLAGYVIECALKVCIAKKTKRHDFPPERKVIERVYSHSLTQLLEPAGIDLEQEFRNDPTLAEKWNIVKDWKETSRYETHGRKKAKDMLQAVDHPEGVLACIKKYW